MGLAGIMGGLRTAVSATTTNILLESASFSAHVIAGRARRLGLQTDAATRFERGVDPTGQQRALERATALLLEITGGQPGPCLVQSGSVVTRIPVYLRRTYLARSVETRYRIGRDAGLTVGMVVRPRRRLAFSTAFASTSTTKWI